MIARCLLGLVLTLLLAMPALGSTLPTAEPELEAGLPLLRNYTPREYGAHGQNWNLIQDRRGLVYVGNNDGVLEFDGARWRLIRTEQHGVVRALAIDSEGQVLVGGVGEFGRLEADAQGRMRYVSLLDRLPEEARDLGDVHHIFVRGEDVYLATYARLISLRGSDVRSFRPEIAFHRAFMARDRLFIRDRGRGLMELVGETLLLVPGSEPFAEARVDFVLPFGDRDALLVGSRDSGLHLIDGGALRPLASDANDVLRQTLVYSGVQLNDGGYAVGTFQGGVFFLDAKGQLRGRLDKAFGLQDDTVLAMLVDHQGGLWLGLDRGLSRVEMDLPISRFDERKGLAGGVLALHRHGSTLYAGSAQGTYRLEPGRPARFVPIHGMRGQTYAFASIGEDLLAGNNDGTYLIQDDHAEQLQQGVTGTTTALLASATRPDRVYVGLWDGLAVLRHEGERWVDEGRIAGIDLTVNSLLEAPDGRLWVGTWTHGSARIALQDGPDGRLTLAKREDFGTTDGLPQSLDNYVQRFAGAPLFSTRAGLFRFDETSRRFHPDAQFASLFGTDPRWVVYGIGIESADRLWMQTKDEHSGVRQPGLAQRLGQGWVWDPKPLAAIANGWHEKVFAESDGHIWFGGTDGLFRIHVDTTSGTTRRDFATRIRRVVAMGEDSALFEDSEPAVAPSLAYAQNSLRFEFAAAYFDSSDSLEYQTRLDGNDRDWSDFSRESFREYTNLAEGAYTLQVRARNREGEVGQAALYPFRILPPWYRTPVAYFTYLLLAVLLVQALLRWRLARLNAEKQALESMVAERTSELREKNELLEAARISADQARARAEDANRAKTTFLANMSHELRTPMNAVLGFAQLMDREPHRNEEDRRHLATILRSGEHLLALINDVLSLSRIEAGALALDLGTFDLRALITNVCELIRLRAETKHLALRVEAGTLPAAVQGDARKLSQILLNLLGNAVKFTQQGGVTLRVRWQSGRAEFEIEDTGSGISASEREQLFAPFMQTEAGRAAKEGTGLGLALSRDMARLMGGDIVLVSAPGQGARFVVTIDLPEQAVEAPLVQHEESRTVRGLAPGQAIPRILVIDDHADNRMLLLELLHTVGFEVRDSGGDEEAITIWRDWHPHLIWLDQRLSGSSGTAIASRIRAEEVRLGRARTRILALSASALDHQRAELLASGCDDFLPKPFREAQLFAMMAAHLGLSYRYEETATETVKQPAHPEAEELARLPEVWRSTMRRHLAVGDLQQARQALNAIEGEWPKLAAALRVMISDYRLDELDALLAASGTP